MVKRTYIRAAVELKEHGYTDRCDGCLAARLGLPPRGHSAECRRRSEHDMSRGSAGRARLEDAGRRLGKPVSSGSAPAGAPPGRVDSPAGGSDKMNGVDEIPSGSARPDPKADNEGMETGIDEAGASPAGRI